MNRDTIKNLTDDKLIDNLEVLSNKERAITLELLLHLIEVEQREVHIALGYPSLFAYVTEKLRYSVSAAWRRIATARCIQEYPEVYTLLERHEVNLTTVSIFRGILNRENVREVLEVVRGKSRKEVEQFVASHRPRTRVRESIKPIAVAIKAPTLELGSPIKTVSPSHFRSGSDLSTESTATEEETTPPTYEKRFRFLFSGNTEFMERYEEAEQLLSSKYPQGVPPEVLFMEALEVLLDKKSPKRREARREKRKERQSKASQKKASCKTSKQTSRYIPQPLRDKVLIRDEHRCTFVGANGKRCCSTKDLQLDHMEPWALGGETTDENLRVVCRKHNKFLAEHSFGREHIEKYCGVASQ